MLPIERVDEVGIREGESTKFVRLRTVSPYQCIVLVILLEPGTTSTKDLDDDGLSSTIVGNAVNLVREGEVDRSQVSVFDIPQDVEDSLGRGYVHLVECTEGVGGSTDLESLSESL